MKKIKIKNIFDTIMSGTTMKKLTSKMELLFVSFSMQNNKKNYKYIKNNLSLHFFPLIFSMSTKIKEDYWSRNLWSFHNNWDLGRSMTVLFLYLSPFITMTYKQFLMGESIGYHLIWKFIKNITCLNPSFIYTPTIIAHPKFLVL